MLVYKIVYRQKWHKWRYTKGKVKVAFCGWFLLGFVPLIVWQITNEESE